MARRYGKPKEVVVNLYGMEGRGKNKTEARADAGVKIEKALAGDYHPRYITSHGKSVLIFRSPDGWQYAFLSNRPERATCTIFGLVGVNDDVAAVERSARRHLAQVIFELGGPTGLEVIENEDDRREHGRWCEFQYCHAAWIKDGSVRNGNEIHRLACRLEWPEGVEPWKYEEETNEQV